MIYEQSSLWHPKASAKTLLKLSVEVKKSRETVTIDNFSAFVFRINQRDEIKFIL